MLRSTRRDAARRVGAHVRNTEISLSFHFTPQASQEIYGRSCRESSARPLFYRTHLLSPREFAKHLRIAGTCDVSVNTVRD